ncbi:MAG: hypothetical protein KIG16_01390 [Eubacteriales bacterium]|nr:hypothetical protein [Eubacteriales bacterium]
MRFGRGRIIALTILSVTIMLAMFGASLFLNFNHRNANPNAISDPVSLDPSYIPTFDDLYQRIAFDDVDTGTVSIGSKTKFTLVQESYNTGTLTSFLRANPKNRVDREEFSTMQNNRRLDKNEKVIAPYPVFSNSDMRLIANGLGNNLEIPVVMLDSSHYDDVVLFELTDLDELLSVNVKLDGEPFVDDVNRHLVSDEFSNDQVYGGFEKRTSGGKGAVVYTTDSTADHKTVLMELNYVPNNKVAGGYALVITDGQAQKFYTIKNDEYVIADNVDAEETKLYRAVDDGNGNVTYQLAYKIHRNGYKVMVKDATDTVLKLRDRLDVDFKGVLLESLTFDPEADNQQISYEIGGVAYNGTALRGIFQGEGLYEIELSLGVSEAGRAPVPVNISIAFMIVNKLNYTSSDGLSGFPRFDTANRVKGYSEVYNYSYESDYPVLSFPHWLFDIEVAEPAPEYFDNQKNSQNYTYKTRELRFYNIGEYQIISTLRYRNSWIFEHLDQYKNRGVDANGCVILKRYKKSESTLNIYGFQAYYGGRHDDSQYVGPKPFYDNNDNDVTVEAGKTIFHSSDISAWLRKDHPEKTAQNSGIATDYEKMTVDNALAYAEWLVQFLESEQCEPVRTNFPPVKLSGNVPHATGSYGENSEEKVLSTVAFLPAYGTGNSRQWQYSTMEVGAPFEEAGQYVVVVYFLVNNQMSQQTFYFEIVNGAQITFEVKLNGESEPKTYQAAELELNQKLYLEGTDVTIKYNGKKTLGKFEVLPTIELFYAEIGYYDYDPLPLQPTNDGSFVFTLNEGQYRLSVKYGAHSKSTTIFNLAVDRQKAQGIHADTKANALTLPQNLANNIAIVGKGEVSLVWNKKSSGVGFDKVMYEFYSMDLEKPGTDPNYVAAGDHTSTKTSLNFEWFNNALSNGVLKDLYSAYAFTDEPIYSHDGYKVVPTADGKRWTISEDGVNPLKLTQAGLYRFVIVDAVGNETPYILVIDGSAPTFTQDTEKPKIASNMVTFGNDGVRVGFGKNKMINRKDGAVFDKVMFAAENGLKREYAEFGTAFDGLKTAGYLINKGNYSSQYLLDIPLANVEISVGGEAYHKITAADDAFDHVNDPLTKGYLTLNEEETYYFRATDILGNVGEYYIILTRDVCLGSVYAESMHLDIVASGDNKGRGMIEKQPSTDTSIVTMTGGVTNRPYVTFSFNQSTSAVYRVNKVYLQYYPLTFDPTSSNYPFAEKPLNNPKNGDKAIFAYQVGDLGAGGETKGTIYSYTSSDDGKTIRLALFNQGQTPAGMYILTRVYTQLGANSTDKKGRDYYFIVDGQGMLTYQKNDTAYFRQDEGTNGLIYQAYQQQNPDKICYETPLTVHFADSRTDRSPKAKDADAKVIDDNEKVLSSNRIAWVKGYNSKYAYSYTDQATGKKYTRDSTEYVLKIDNDEGLSGNFNYLAYLANNETPKTNFNFPALTPRFSYTNAGIKTDLGSGKNVWGLGGTFTGDSIYQLLVTDDARNIACMLIDGNITELGIKPGATTSANWDILTMNIDTDCGTPAKIAVTHTRTYQDQTGNEKTEILSEDKENIDMELASKGNYVCVIDPTNLTKLQFNFKSDPNSMYIDVDVAQTTASWIWTSDGVTEQIFLTQPESEDGVYKYDLLRNFLNNVRIDNGSSLSVRVIAYDGKSTNYTILFDTEKPNYNRSQIKAGDNLACTLKESKIPDDYIYGLSNDFVFAADINHNRYLDTKKIIYREVDYSAEGSTVGQEFTLYVDGTDSERIPFATLVGLRDNEMRYYWITEIDYVGHETNYVIQMQGKNYKNKIEFIGETGNKENSAQKDSITVGVDMHPSVSSVKQFFARNNSFRFQSDDGDYYMVLGGMSYWKIAGEEGEDVKNEANLIDALNHWIQLATDNGKKCSYTLYDRIGTPEKFEFYNLRESTEQIQLECKQLSVTSSIITLEVVNHGSLLKNAPIMFEDELSSLYKIEVKDVTTGEIVPNITFALDRNKADSVIPANEKHELIITVVDPFGRTSITEYHQQAQSTINFKTYGKFVKDENGILYIGDERGVDFSYLRTVYSVLIYDASTNEKRWDLQPFVTGDRESYSFKPVAGSNTLQLYRIEAYGRASGAKLFDQTFAFDTRLPEVNWQNASGQNIEVANRSFTSVVVLNVAELDNTETGDGLLNPFPVMISYRRTVNGKVESVTFKRGTTTARFSKVGSYEVTLRNTVWTTKTYKFEIVQVDNTLVSVYDDGELLQAVEGSPYRYDNNNITHYIFTIEKNQEGQYDALSEYTLENKLHGLDVQLGQTGRVLAGYYLNGNKKTDYYAYDVDNNTLIWRLAFDIGTDRYGAPIYSNPIYFATTGVRVEDLNTANENSDLPIISLQLNDNPKEPADTAEGYKVKPATTTYDIVYNNFFTTKDEGRKLTVSMLYADTLTDDFGAPCYIEKGNLIVVDCYYNGKLVKTLNYNEVFTIEQGNSGYYEFVVHDMVGNTLYFGEGTNEKTIDYRQDHYTLAVMTKPVVTINGEQPFNNMIYNDRVDLKLDDYGKESFLKKYYASLVEKKVADVSTSEEDFFEQYFCVRKIDVSYNGDPLTSIEPNSKQSVFSWTQSGVYNLTVKYYIYGAGELSSELEGRYTFEIIPSKAVREEFHISYNSDVAVSKLTLNGYDVPDYSTYEKKDDKGNRYLSFEANTNPGNYVVTLQTKNPITHEYVLHDVAFNIQHKDNSAGTYFFSSSASGSSTTSAITVYYNPYWLYKTQGDMTITLEKDCEEKETIILSAASLKDDNVGTAELFNFSEAGSYCVIARNAEGVVVYSDSWTIAPKQSTFGYVVLIVVLALVGIGVLLFIRLRHRMTTK